MHRTRGTKQWCWRWRSNPLRRHDDVVEAWIVLVVWVVILVGGALVGLVAARTADASFARLRSERHPVPAVLVDSTARTLPTGDGPVYDGVRATVRWKGPDGATHTGRTLVNAGHPAGSKVMVWLDRKGRLTTRPPDPGTASAEAGALGTGAAIAFGSLVFAGGRLARWRLDRRRYDEWARAWEQVGPRWGHKTP
ncbi:MULTISPECIES: Rv1733c family protein [unclassified Streptomyces]|uniref:Rv1733c family protein n=1 Tax=unclassified Streptomyces TaxID=2593676 RepID=UPI0011CE51A3|nr:MULTISPECIES: hypothetical protein [unclassified Streptomyces]TXS75810.1 hypothetical protein EAO69_12920 [Streptomyces sp. me109]